MGAESPQQPHGPIPYLARTLAGVVCIFALLFFFFLDLTTPEISITQEMLAVMVGLIVALMGLDDIRGLLFGHSYQGGPMRPSIAHPHDQHGNEYEHPVHDTGGGRER